MNKLLVLVFVITSTITFGQTGKIIYKIESIKKDNLDKPKVKSVKKELELMNYSLRYDNSNSLFKKEPHIPANKMFSDLAQVLMGAKNPIYQDLKQKEVVTPKNIGQQSYLVVKKEPMNDWELTAETKKIENYTCYKAVRKILNKRASKGNNKVYRVFEAWYTPEIPIGYGPLGNGGLPGMILQLDRVNFVRLTAVKIILNKNNQKIKTPKEHKKITVAESVRLSRKARKVTVD